MSDEVIISDKKWFSGASAEVLEVELDACEHINDQLKSQLAQSEAKLKIAVSALEESIKWKLHYKNDDGSEPDIFDADSWSDVGSHELRDILVETFETAREALAKIGENVADK